MGQICQSISLECQDGTGPSQGPGMRLRRNQNKSQLEMLQEMGQMKLDGFDNCTYQIVETQEDAAKDNSAKIQFMQDNHMVQELNVTVDIQEVDNQIKVVLTDANEEEKDKVGKKTNQDDMFSELKMTESSAVLKSNRPSIIQQSNSEGRAVEQISDQLVEKQIKALKQATKEDSAQISSTSIPKADEKPSDAVKPNPLAALAAAGGKPIDLKKLVQENLQKEIQNKMTRMTIVKQETQRMATVGGDDSDLVVDDDDDFDDDDDSSDYQEETKTQPQTGDKTKEQSSSDKDEKDGVSPKETAAEAIKLTSAK